jgi:hypothetical protein
MYTATTIVKNYICQTNYCSTIIIITIIIIIIKEVITSGSSFNTPTRDIEAVAHICYNAGNKAISNTVAEKGWSKQVVSAIMY